MSNKKKEINVRDLVESHRPKNFKYKFIFNNDDILDELNDMGYDLSRLDTINDDTLVQEALKADYTEYGRDIVARAKEPTILGDGVIVSKKMVTKADKKLLAVLLGFFEYNNMRHVAIRLRYEKFDIVEIFILT